MGSNFPSSDEKNIIADLTGDGHTGKPYVIDAKGKILYLEDRR
jgi:hypothetical protein